MNEISPNKYSWDSTPIKDRLFKISPHIPIFRIKNLNFKLRAIDLQNIEILHQIHTNESNKFKLQIDIDFKY